MGDVWIYGAHTNLAREAARVLAELGFTPRRVAANGSLRPGGEDGATVSAPDLALVVGGVEPGLCERLRSDEQLDEVPLLVTVCEEDLPLTDDMMEAHELLIAPFTAAELRARVTRARRRLHGVGADDVLRFGTLELNLATYQVEVDRRPIGLTYMEFELLKFLATHPGRVFSREALLSRVWGYDYYGGARTVDVHVRRVRAKLGSSHSARIQTVRSVGYRFAA
jgi:DNA-binding response OmpR family regulator